MREIFDNLANDELIWKRVHKNVFIGNGLSAMQLFILNDGVNDMKQVFNLLILRQGKTLSNLQWNAIKHHIEKTTKIPQSST